MKKKSESPLNSLNLGGIKPPPEDVERKLARIIKTINSVAERSDNLDVALENEGWRRAVKWLVSHRELAEVTQTWLESSQFGLRMAAICTAAAWVKEEFDRIHWL